MSKNKINKEQKENLLRLIKERNLNINIEYLNVCGSLVEDDEEQPWYLCVCAIGKEAINKLDAVLTTVGVILDYTTLVDTSDEEGKEYNDLCNGYISDGALWETNERKGLYLVYES